ncbi:MAG: copper amine oxidase N-terminal domain-containing protein [Caldisericia bacterium]|nr:copper amine oxidase N-terminal domain-containing protein [Caldisericia bacterium]
MRKIVALVLIISIFFAFTLIDSNNGSYAKLNSPPVEWELNCQRDGDFQINASIETPFEEYYFCGTNKINLEEKQIIVFKTDFNGNEIWNKSIKISKQAIGVNIHLNPNNTLTAIGNYISEDTGKWSICIINLTRDGKIMWEKSIGSDVDQYIYNSILTIDHTVVMLGYSETKKQDKQAMYITNISLQGKIIWEKVYSDSKNEIGKDCVQLYDENFLFVGESISDHGLINVTLLKTDLYGVKIWKKVYTSKNNYAANKIIISNDHGYLILGETDAYTDNIGIYLMKIDETGKKQWEKFYDNNSSSIGKDIIPTNQEGYIIVGATNVSIDDVLNQNGSADAYTLFVDTHGNKLADEKYGYKGHDAFLSVIRTTDLGFLLVGRSMSGTKGKLQGFIVKLAPILEDGPALYVNKNTLSFGIVKKTGHGEKQYITLENGGEGLLSGFISTSDRWITTSDRSFIIPTFGSLQIIVNVLPDELLEGRYQGEIYITSNGGDIKLYVYIVVIDNSPVLTIVPKTLDFGLIRDRDVLKKEFRIINQGRTNLYGQLKSETDWITLEKSSFFSNDQMIVVNLHPERMKNGLQKGYINIDTNGGKEKYEVRVLCGFPVVIIRITIGNATAQVNGVDAPIDENNKRIVPFILSGRTLIPIRFISESFGAKVDWFAEEKQVRIALPKRGMEIILKINNTIAIIDGEELIMDVAPIIFQGRVFVPIRFVAEAFGAEIKFYKPETNDPPYIVISFER